MKRITAILVLLVLCILFAGCGAQQPPQEAAPTDGQAPAQPSYDENAQPGDENVAEDENGNLIVPSYTEGYGNSHATICVTTPNLDGNYDVITYHFPDATLSSLTYEMHFANEDEAKRVFELQQQANAADLKIEGSVVTYTDTDSEWIGYKKRDIIDNLSKTWEQLGYTVVIN